jgi:hypothetical protein
MAIGKTETPLEDGAAPTEHVTRIIKDTSLYETAVGLYPVLLALILTDSLKDMAINIVDHPLTGNWSQRFLTCALLVLSAVWLHVWIATFRKANVTGDTRHCKYPGFKMKSVKGYALAIWLFWLGIIQLIIFACMAYSVTREKEFFLESTVYAAILLVYSSLDINVSEERVWKRPWKAIGDLWGDGRHLPLSEDDLKQFVEASRPDQKKLASQGSVYDMTMGLVLVAISLALYLIVTKFGPSSWVALAALIGIVMSVVMDYYVYPYFYLL